MHLAKWENYYVVFNIPANQDYIIDYLHGLNLLIALQPSIHVTQYLGACNDIYVTEYHPLGSADSLDFHLSNTLGATDNLTLRFNLCIDYVSILNRLHTHQNSTLVMCDSNSLHKILTQYLLTSDMRLVVNDLDSIAILKHSSGSKIKCGHRQLFGDFVAPEQLWPFEEDFNDEAMPGYDEKSDIWKVPNVCEFFLGKHKKSQSLQYHLFKIHKQCKSVNPADRPTAKNILMEYIRIKKEFKI